MSDRTANAVLEEGCEGTTFERKYYRRGMSYIKCSLRSNEFKHGYHGLYVPRLRYESLQNEAECLRYVRDKTDIPVPQVYADFEDDGAYYLITEFIEGTPMNELPEQDKAPVRDELQRHLATLHSLKSNTIGGPAGRVVIPRPLMERTDQDIWTLKPSQTDEFVFCDNDLSEYNIIVNPATLKIAAIIDWEYAGFYPEFFEAPLYTRHGPRAQVTNDEGRVSRMLEFLQMKEQGEGRECYHTRDGM